MVRGTQAQISSLVYVAFAGILLLAKVDPIRYGICEGCSVAARFAYPFLHANVFHFIVNAWCLLSIVFTYDMSILMLLLSYIVSVSAPAGLLCIATPTVGASAMIYFLLGSLSMRVKRKWYWQAWWAFFIAIGFFMSSVAASLHLWCYAVGVIVSLLTTPIRWER